MLVSMVQAGGSGVGGVMVWGKLCVAHFPVDLCIAVNLHKYDHFQHITVSPCLSSKNIGLPLPRSNMRIMKI